MSFEPRKYRPHSLRLAGFDYRSRGAYALVLCTRNRVRYFADPLCYQIVEKAWKRIPRHFPTVVPDSIGIVADHIHMILFLEPTETVKPLLGDIVSRFKSDVARAMSCNMVLQRKGIINGPIWQIRFYDHIIRDARDLENERRYVLENPEKHRLHDEGCE